MQNYEIHRRSPGRYMTEVASGGGVTITAVDATQDKAEFINFYSSLSGFDWQHVSGASGFLDSGTALQDVPLDTLIIDIYNPKSHQLLWRGAVTEPAAKSEDKNDRTIDHAVTLLISKYPPKYKKP
jgi:D-alanyl-D-alanine dipeptidase